MINRGSIRGHVDRESLNSDSPIWFTAATEGTKADGIDLRMQGAQLERFRSNPVILYGHQTWGRQSLPIGRAENVGVEGDRLRMAIRFDESDDFATTVERKLRNGFLNAVSISFEVREWETPGQSYWKGGVAVKWDLLETSVVSIPMDEKAVVESGRSLHDENLRQYLDELVAREVKENFRRYFLNEEKQSVVSTVDATKVMSSFTFGEN